MKKVAILQSNYIPWKGYFDMIAAVDEFIIYDDVQYTKGDWRNRNQIKTPHGIRWLTVPVKNAGRFGQTIRETELDGDRWRQSHWGALVQNYRQARCFDEIAEFIEPLYRSDCAHISEVNRMFLEAICRYLGISTKISNSWDYVFGGGRSERLADLCRQARADEYITGPSAKNYLECCYFERAGIGVTWFDYFGYQEYPQLWGEFTHNVSILDLLFNCGKDSVRYMRYLGGL